MPTAMKTTMRTTPIFHAFKHVANTDQDENIVEAAKRVLNHATDFETLPGDQVVEAYDRINGEGSFDARCDMAEGRIDRDGMIERCRVDLAYGFTRELFERAAGQKGLATMQDLSLRVCHYLTFSSGPTRN